VLFLILKNELENKLIEYCEELEIIKNLSSKTVENYKMTNTIFISYLHQENIKNLDNIEQTLKKYIIYLKKKRNAKYSTINKYLEQIILFLSYIGIETKIDLPKDNSKNKKIKYLKYDEIEEVLKTIPETFLRDKTIIQTLFRTGLRVSELSNLKKQDLNLDKYNNIITVNIEDGKGGKDRTVYLDTNTYELINKMIYKRTRKNKKDKTSYLFTNKYGNQISIRAIENLVKKWAIKTDDRMKEKGKETNFQDKLTPHALRHSFTIYLLNNAKRPINEVQQLLGHSSIATTQIYTQVDSEDMKKGYNAINW